ncbi:tRNA uracil 4-sulfurtransferase ThiI [Paraglaciecola sp.]|uniref:tRNA uracil 4-sulfurtransferase ThiI n=1 Tax=Paraglaciecola sp. TaxID=1920173 RepID=UPI00274016C1|nr:tRNA uracil 4-sulfurtransferase ThiI [Paraglaciecola sp.]MDP5029408.1 tRNA 4-thiouridine(8) synthase ThiI [Paraglaciecola sp.]
MKFIIKLHPEILIKSKAVRKRFTRLLEGNIRLVFKRNELSVEVRHSWDKLVLLVNPKAIERLDEVIALLQRIPGIDQILDVQESQFTDLEDIYQQVKGIWQDKLAGLRFAVKVKRRGQHNFSSLEAAAYIGGRLKEHCASSQIKLKNPDITIDLDITDNTLIFNHQRIKCLGGMPLPSQEDVLSLISGGFDSGVASYQLIRRGARTHFCFFNLGGREHEIGVKQVSYYLWQRYSESHKVKFVMLDFSKVVNEIVEKVDNNQMGVVLKRMMVRAASMVADKLNINALVTGECIGQVASQTISNLQIIDQATDKLIIRPLVCMDKSDIINIARQIGTEDFARVMPEYCGVVSRKPTVKALLSTIVNEEAKIDGNLLKLAVEEANFNDIRSILDETQQLIKTVNNTQTLPDGAVVIDIRSFDEQEAKPLVLKNNEVKHIPFFKLANQLRVLDAKTEYFLYCEKGVMSQLQALLLLEQGHSNVQVYKP